VLTRSNAQHARLLQALARRDAARSVRLLREHLAGTEHILAGLMPAERRKAPSRADQPRSNIRARS
jgi:DNA-binding GntR family transcriptional regulator